VSSEIELVSDGEGVVVAGDRGTVERFLDGAGLLEQAHEFALGKLSATLRAGSDLAEVASGIAEQSAMYLKLTPESAQALKDAGGLMKTKTEGVSHAMLGDPGRIGKWLQVEDGPASLLTNPAVLSGVGGRPPPARSADNTTSRYAGSDGTTSSRCSAPSGTPGASKWPTAASAAPVDWRSRSRTPPPRPPAGSRSPASPPHCATCHAHGRSGLHSRSQPERPRGLRPPGPSNGSAPRAWRNGAHACGCLAPFAERAYEDAGIGPGYDAK
jgi:hypothetical protein